MVWLKKLHLIRYQTCQRFNASAYDTEISEKFTERPQAVYTLKHGLLKHQRDITPTK